MNNKNELFKFLTSKIDEINSADNKSSALVAEILEESFNVVSNAPKEFFDSAESYERLKENAKLYKPLVDSEIKTLKNTEYINTDDWFEIKATIWALRTFLGLGL